MKTNSYTTQTENIQTQKRNTALAIYILTITAVVFSYSFYAAVNYL